MFFKMFLIYFCLLDPFQVQSDAFLPEGTFSNTICILRRQSSVSCHLDLCRISCALRLIFNRLENFKGRKLTEFDAHLFGRLCSNDLYILVYKHFWTDRRIGWKAISTVFYFRLKFLVEIFWPLFCSEFVYTSAFVQKQVLKVCYACSKSLAESSIAGCKNLTLD